MVAEVDRSHQDGESMKIEIHKVISGLVERMGRSKKGGVEYLNVPMPANVPLRPRRKRGR